MSNVQRHGWAMLCERYTGMDPFENVRARKQVCSFFSFIDELVFFHSSVCSQTKAGSLAVASHVCFCSCRHYRREPEDRAAEGSECNGSWTHHSGISPVCLPHSLPFTQHLSFHTNAVTYSQSRSRAVKHI